MNLFNNKVWGILLCPLSFIYRWGVLFRRKLYDLGIYTSVRLPAKVISVGNITVGGTGKTPLVETLARILKDEGCRVGILSRGYGRSGRGTLVVSDGKEIRTVPRETGDEPMLLARNLPGIPIVVGQNRIQAGQLAIQSFGCNILILDDGFQHLCIRRDIDLVVIDASNPFGNGRLIPAGPLREQISSLKRADAICFTRVDEEGNMSSKEERIRKHSHVPILASTHHPTGWISTENGRMFPLDGLKRKTVLAFAGIGNPESFRKTLKTLNVEPVAFLKYRDHYWYTEKDLIHICDTAKREGAEAIVTTEKDGIRLPEPLKCSIPLYSLKIKLLFKGGTREIKRILSPVLMSNG